MSNGPSGGGFLAGVLAHVVCCGGLLLFATGVLTVNSVGTWLLGGGAIWLVLGGIAVTLFLLWRRQRTGSMPRNGRARAADTDQVQ